MDGNNSKIKFIYFDLGGVFFDWKVGLQKIAKITSSPMEKVIEIFKDCDSLLCSGEKPSSYLYQKFREILNCGDFANGNFADYWTSSFESFKEMVPLVKKLEHTYDLGIISNIYNDTYENLSLKRLIPDIHWKHKVLSYQIGLLKPDIRIYEYAQKLTQLPANNILFVDDSKENLVNPSKMGWNTIWFDNTKIKDTIKAIEKFLINVF